MYNGVLILSLRAFLSRLLNLNKLITLQYIRCTRCEERDVNIMVTAEDAGRSFE